MSKLFGKKKKQQQGNGGGGAAGGGTGTEAAALRGPKRGLGGRIQDGWDRFKYWAGGGGKAVNNKTRNWLADGKEGSWRRNKAERLADKEYESGLQKVGADRLIDTNAELQEAVNDNKYTSEVYDWAKDTGFAREEVAGIDRISRLLTELGIEDSGVRAEYLSEMTDIVREMMSAGGNLYNQYKEALSTGEGSVEKGIAEQRAKDDFFKNLPEGYEDLPQQQKTALRRSRMAEIMKEKYGIQQEEIGMGESYRAMLERRVDRDRDKATLTCDEKRNNAARRQKILEDRIRAHR